MKIKRKYIGVTVVAMSVAIITPTVTAGNYGVEVMPGMHTVPDDKLSSMHGKYVSSTNQVIYFGVQMSSNWSAPNGSVMSAGSNFSVDVSSPTPKLNFTSYANLDSEGGDITDADETARIVDSSGVGNVSGMTQSIQVSGDENVLENIVRVSMLDDIPDVGVVTDNSKPSSFSYSDGSVDLSASSGLDEKSLSVKMGMKGQGEVEQTVRGYIEGHGGKGALQRISVIGDHHIIVNQMELEVVMQKASSGFVTQQHMGSAINSLRGVGSNM